VFVWVVGED